MNRLVIGLVLALLATGCNHCNNSKPVDKHNVSLDTLEKWCYSDTSHNKLICFFSMDCGGCIYQFQMMSDIIPKLDSAKWKMYFLITSTDNGTDINLKTISQQLSKYGIADNDIYIWNDGHDVCDSTFYNKITHSFKSHHPVEIHSGVPNIFIIDRHGYLAIMKAYTSFELTESKYIPWALGDDIVNEFDFSKDNGTYVVVIEDTSKDNGTPVVAVEDTKP